MKKLLLSLGALSAVVAPVAAVVACGSTETPAKTEEGATTPLVKAQTDAVKTITALPGLTPVNITSYAGTITKATTEAAVAAVVTDATRYSNTQVAKAAKVKDAQSKWVEAAIEEFFLEDGKTGVKNYSDTAVFNAVKAAFDAKFAETGLTLGLATNGQMLDEGPGSLSYALVINSEAPFTISDSDLGTTDTTSGYQFKNGNTTLDVNNKVYKMDTNGEFYYDLTEVNMNKVIEAKWSTKFATATTASKSAFVLYIQKQSTGHTFEIEKLLHNGDKVLVSDQYDEATVTE